MSHDASTKQVLLNPPQDELSARSAAKGAGLGMETTAGNVAVESYADRLMDDLFGDVEQLLGGEARSTPPEPSAPSSPETHPAPPAVEPATVGMPLVQRAQPEAAPDPLVSQSAAPIESAPPVADKSRKQGLVYDRFLLAIGCVSLLATLAMWLLYQESRRPQVTANIAVNQVSDPVNEVANQQFADYVQRSLQMIDQKMVASAPPSASALPPNAALPNVSVPPTQTPTAPGAIAPVPGASTGLSKLYSPFYRSAQGASPGMGFPFTVTPPLTPLPTLPSRTATAPVKQPIPLSVPGVARTLVGVVEMGDQSAILVEINGVAQRFKLGESIGSSGWALVEVSKNQAIMRRNGEVRSVFIGQSF